MSINLESFWESTPSPTERIAAVRLAILRMAVVMAAGTLITGSLGVGTATAKDPYVGMTYAQASSRVADRGGTPVVSTVVGNQLSTDDCIVESWRRPSFAADNFEHDKKSYLFSLNCSAKLAHPGLPGHSLASPEGRAQRKLEDRAERFNANPERCTRALESCRNFCEKNAGLCSKEVLALL